MAHDDDDDDEDDDEDEDDDDDDDANKDTVPGCSTKLQHASAEERT